MRIALDYFSEPLAFENQTAIVLTLEKKNGFSPGGQRLFRGLCR